MTPQELALCIILVFGILLLINKIMYKNKYIENMAGSTSGNILDQETIINMASISKRGDTSLTNLAVSNNLTVQANATINKDVNIKNNLTVQANATINKDVNIKNNLIVDKDTSIKNNLTVDKDANIKKDIKISTGGKICIGNSCINEDHLKMLLGSVDITLKRSAGNHDGYNNFVGLCGGSLKDCSNANVALVSDINRAKFRFYKI
jgi:NDP-sugar pyrophosphorylase family protein